MADIQVQFSQIDNANVDDTIILPVKDPDAAAGSKGKWATLGQLLTGVVRTVAGVVASLQVTSLTSSTHQTGTLTVGAGATVSKVLSVASDVAIPTIGAHGSDTVTMAVSGAAVGDFVALSAMDALNHKLVISGRVTAPDVVTITVCNGDSGSVTGATYEIRAMVVRFA